jgi:hypothetical protein
MNEFQELIEKAKLRVIQAYDHQQPPTPRKWLIASPPDSYGNSDFHVTLMVLEGSPAKGYVIVDYGKAMVIGISAWGRKLLQLRTKSGLV